MSSKGKITTATGGSPPFVPERRFIEFQGDGPWTTVTLASVAKISNEKVRDKTCIPMSITSGVGLVSQMEKFGRVIAGESYKNYLLLKKNDFAYNKSSTKEYPEGFIGLYRGEELAAVPNSIFTCFRIKGESPSPEYLNYLFLGNLHGRWLQKFIEVGARAHGSLSINDNNLMALPVPVPAGSNSLKEQHKIVDCLSSADALIEAQGRKVEALRAHKKGLMQQLFPLEGETQPRLRFPEFRDVGDWKEEALATIIDLISGMHLSPDDYSSSGEVPYFTGPSDFTNDVRKVTKWANLKAKSSQAGDILITVKGSGVGEVWFSTLPRVAMGRQLMSIRAKRGANPSYIFQLLLTKNSRFEDLGSGNLIPGLSRDDVLELKVCFPSPPEQKRVADCLSSLDDLIAAEAQKLDTLKTHKKGLMQQLFPLVGEDDE